MLLYVWDFGRGGLLLHRVFFSLVCFYYCNCCVISTPSLFDVSFQFFFSLWRAESPPLVLIMIVIVIMSCVGQRWARRMMVNVIRCISSTDDNVSFLFFCVR